MRQLPSQREIHGQRTRTAYLQVLPIPTPRGAGGYEAVQRGGTRRVQISHVTPGLGTAGKVRPKIQGYGVRQVCTGHAGYETAEDVLPDEIDEKEKIPFADLEDDIRYELEELLADNINEFMIHKDYIPEGKDLKAINEWVIKEAHEAFFIQVVPDTAYNNLVDEIIRRFVKEWDEDGMEIKKKNTAL